MKIYALLLLMSAILAASHLLERRKLTKTEASRTADGRDHVIA